MTEKKLIPKFDTVEDEMRFWDEHNLTDFDAETESVAIVLELDSPRDKTLAIRLQTGVRNQLDVQARNRGLDVSSLARMWIMEKLQSGASPEHPA